MDHKLFFLIFISILAFSSFIMSSIFAFLTCKHKSEDYMTAFMLFGGVALFLVAIAWSLV